ncbi:adenylyl-sulfate kinase [Sinorhizobium meliloti]|uniref:adenylyl-sulfate kinase n=1 Tax=Rhizobium meliloti TaxID=382 RepID=UPI002090566D|nr:adenylyl-sulfate kinase [Sinorhizobium meliloti]MCO5966727.1 adenylyl-sulfate kinase [Sinorhizobium meliloti]
MVLETTSRSQHPAVPSLTGLSGSGKAIADALDRLLTGDGKHMFPFGGDNLDHGPKQG